MRARILAVIAVVLAAGVALADPAVRITPAFITQALADARYLLLSGGALTGAVTSTAQISTAFSPTVISGNTDYMGARSAPLRVSVTGTAYTTPMLMLENTSAAGDALYVVTGGGAYAPTILWRGTDGIAKGITATGGKLSADALNSVGQLSSTLNPVDTAFASGSLIANPGACASNEILLGGGVASSAKFTADCEGDTVAYGTLDARGSITNGGATNGGAVHVADALTVTGNTTVPGSLFSSTTGLAFWMTGGYNPLTLGTTSVLTNSGGTNDVASIFKSGSTAHAPTCTDVVGVGAGALTLNPTSSTVIINNADTLGGCVVTVGETTGATVFHVTVCSSPDSQNTLLTFPDVANVFRCGASQATGLLPGDCFEMKYIDAANDLWLATTPVSIN